MPEGMPPSKQQQHEEALAPLDDQERRAVQKRLMRRNHGSGASHTSRSTARDRYSDPAFAKSGPASGRRSGRQVYTARSAMTTSRSMMTTARSSSPTGRYHPDPTRRLELRKVGVPCVTIPASRPLTPCFACPRRPRRARPRHLPRAGSARLSEALRPEGRSAAMRTAASAGLSSAQSARPRSPRPLSCLD